MYFKLESIFKQIFSQNILKFQYKPLQTGEISMKPYLYPMVSTLSKCGEIKVFLKLFKNKIKLIRLNDFLPNES